MNEQQTMYKIVQADWIVNVSPSQPDGWWESEISAGHCQYDADKKSMHIGESAVYGAHHHYPCGDPKIDAELKLEIENRALQWGAIWERTPAFPWPIHQIYFLGDLMWPVQDMVKQRQANCNRS